MIFQKADGERFSLSTGKSRITVYVDDTILEELRSRAEEAGMGYQTIINEALKEYLSKSSEEPITESMLRRILHEEFPKVVQSASREWPSAT